MVNLLPYDIHESADGGVRFKRRGVSWDDFKLALRRPSLGALLLVAFLLLYLADGAEQAHQRFLGLDPSMVAIGIAAVVVAVGFGVAYAVYRRAAESLVFDPGRGVLRIGRGREIPFSKLDGAYCVRDHGTYTDDARNPIETFEVYVRSGERRIPLAVLEDRYEGERLAETLQRLIGPRR